MTKQKFREVLNRRIAKIQELVNQKEKEYGKEDEQFTNLKRQAEILRCKPVRTLAHGMSKHLANIFEMIDEHERSGATYPMEMWDEKIGDAIIYLIMLEGIIQEGLCKQKLP